MIKVKFKNKNGVHVIAFDLPKKEINNDNEMMDYIAEYLKNMKLKYNWFKNIT